MKRQRHVKFTYDNDDKTMKDFIVDDDDGSQYDHDDEDYEEDIDYFVPNKRRKLFDGTAEKRLKTIEKLGKDQEVTIDKVFKLDISDEDVLWFIEYLNIFDNTMAYTEERYRIKTLIYNRYKEFAKNQRHKKEIEKLKTLGNISKSTVDKIIESKQSDNVKAILFKKYEKYLGPENDVYKNDEYFKDTELIDTVLNLPTEIKTINTKDIGAQIINLKNSLDNKLYGMDSVKENIIEAFCAMANNPEYKKKFITLVGPPGVGKTAIAEAIAESMNIPFDQISIGSIKDANVLTGHSSTYIGSAPGMFVTILKKAKVLNPVILLDEVDKIPNTPEGQSIRSVLIHALDKTQNNKFKDMYIPEVPLNLSNVLFILTMNNEDGLDEILKNRLQIIKLEGYTYEDKITIAKNYILPKTLKSLSFSDEDIIFTDKATKHLINKINEPGVRDLEKKIITICEKINVLRFVSKSKKKIKLSYSIDNIKFPLNVTEAIVDKLLA